MEDRNIYEDIAARTQGDIYIGVVGPVRTGKSTFIKKFMDTLVIPNIEEGYQRERAFDELPQSAAGRTIMTTEPKFIPEEAVEIKLDNNAAFRVRMIDCVGYIVPSSLGYIEGEQPRMVKTPWSDEELPFNVAAEMGTHKVIAARSTIGLVVTTGGSISDIPRYEYEEAEERVIKELQEINKPFIVLLNCMYPQSASARSLADELSEKYQVPVVPINCIELSENEIVAVLTQVLYEFPVKEIEVELPAWLSSLNSDHWLKSSVFGQIKTSASKLTNMRTVTYLSEEIAEMENISGANIESMSLGTGRAHIKVTMSNVLFYKVIEELTKIKIENEQDLMKTLTDLSMVKVKYERLKDALDEVEATGYGIVMPTIDELKLEEPEIMKQGGKYGVRLKASAPSVHMLRADITTEVAPIVGSESQSEELVKYLLQGFEEDPQKIWESNIFGKSLHELVNEGLKNKLFHMPADARMKLQETLERIINEGCSGLICIIL